MTSEKTAVNYKVPLYGTSSKPSNDVGTIHDLGDPVHHVSTPNPLPLPKPKPKPNPPKPNPTPNPTPCPSGPIFGSGSPSDDSTSVPSNDVTTTDGTAVASGVDLVLEDVKLAAPATLVAGPAYTVKFRNQGSQDAGKFEVGLLAGVNGRLTQDAPRAVIEVKSLPAGKSAEVTLRLPQSALKLLGANGRPAAFTHLFVAVDLLNTVAESDETNNTAVVARTELETIAAQ